MTEEFINIDGLPAATTPLNDADLFEVLQSGVNKKVAKSDIGGTATLQEDITRAALLVKIGNGILNKGQGYKITDAAASQNIVDFGLVVTATSNNTISASGIGGFLNADFQKDGDYSGVSGFTLYNTTDKNGGVWTVAKESILINGNVIIWNCKHYKVANASAFNGTNPATNTTAYTLLAKSAQVSGSKYGYSESWDFIIYCFEADYLSLRQDDTNNIVTDNAYAIVNSIQKFQWGRKTMLNNVVINESLIDNINQIDGYMEANFCTNAAQILANGATGDNYTGINNNNMFGGVIDATDSTTQIAFNIVNNGAFINAQNCTLSAIWFNEIGIQAVLNLSNASGAFSFFQNILMLAVQFGKSSAFTADITGQVFNNFPQFADNAAALAGGMQTSTSYRVTGTGDVKVVI